MKAAFTIWNGRIAPVFDVAGQIALVKAEDLDTPQPAQIIPFPGATALEKLWFLKQYGVEVLVCGAMTCSSYYAARNYGIQVHRFIAGDSQSVINSWHAQDTLEQKFAMPGCSSNFPPKHCRRQRYKNRHESHT